MFALATLASDVGDCQCELFHIESVHLVEGDAKAVSTIHLLSHVAVKGSASDWKGNGTMFRMHSW